MSEFNEEQIQDLEQRIQELLDESSSYLGMIDEAKAKTCLLRARLQVFNTKDEDEEIAFQEEIQCQIGQIRQDLAKYSKKLKQVHKELEDYGVTFEVE